MDFNTLINDYNGSVLLEPGTAEWGYVESSWYLQVPYDTIVEKIPTHAISVDPFPDHINTNNFLKANFTMLNRNDTLANPEKALFGALLRMHFVKFGLFEIKIKERCVIEDEYAFFTPPEKNWNHADVGIPVIPQSKNIAAFVKKFGHTIMHMMVYAFVSRGHHWQDEYDGLYNRLFQACGIAKPNGWAFPTNKELFRQIIHCFGVKIPLDATLYCRDHSLMAQPMRLRFLPHCPVAGAAQITTLNATLLEMRNEGWWQAFENKFHGQIAAVINEVIKIDEDPYVYHVASRVITGKAKKDLSQESLLAFKALCQYALGYISHLSRKHSLYGQKVITQKSGGEKPIAEAFSQACDRFGKPNLNVDSMSTFIKEL